jgi:hypothetical protein
MSPPTLGQEIIQSRNQHGTGIKQSQPSSLLHAGFFLAYSSTVKMEVTFLRNFG